MIPNTKCECGHQNYVGTVLCEACGKPLDEDESATAPLEMRYDGVARRSQRTNPSLIDRVWNFFSSVRNAVILILLTLVGASLGTILPQENTFINVNPATYYPDTYGNFGKFYYALGLTHTYNSWWFKLLLVMIGASLVICSLDRVLPLYRALSKQKIRKHLIFIRRQRVSFSTALTFGEGGAEQWIDELKVRLRKRRYKVHTDGTALLAEKNRFSRWGPYINHIGLILFLLAVLMRGLPGWYMDQYVAFVEGVPKQIPHTDYYVLNKKFTVDYYKPGEVPADLRNKQIPKLYDTKAVLYRCTANCGDPLKKPVLHVVDKHDILVNHPLDYKGLMLYQFDYKESPMIVSENVGLYDQKTGKVFGRFNLNMFQPAEDYKAGPYHLTLKNYFPDFGLDKDGQPITNSKEPNAPAFIFQIKGPNLPSKGDIYIFFPRLIDRQKFSQDQLNGKLGARFVIQAGSMKDVQISNYISYLNVRVDRALPYIFIGAGIFLLGVVMGLYWQHRRIWIRIDNGNELSLGAHTNKNWFGLRKEISSALEQIGLQIDPSSLENEVLKS